MEIEGVPPSGGAEEVPESRLSRLRQLVELLVVLALIVPSSVIGAFAYQQQHVTFSLVAWGTMVRDLALVALILFFLWRNGEPRRAIGWQFRWSDLAVGAVLYLPFMLVISGMEAFFQALGLRAPSSIPAFLFPKSTADYVLAGALVIVVAVSEETIFRGYLLLRLRGIGASVAAALIISAGLFAMGHGYEGSAGVATVGVMGLLFGLIYLWRGNLAAPIMMHFLQDFLGLIVLPLATRGH